MKRPRPIAHPRLAPATGPRRPRRRRLQGGAGCVCRRVSLDRKNPQALEALGRRTSGSTTSPGQAAPETGRRIVGRRALALAGAEPNGRPRPAEKRHAGGEARAHEYLSRDPRSVDEPVLNALGVALFQADRTRQGSALPRRGEVLRGRQRQARINAAGDEAMGGGVDRAGGVGGADARWQSQRAAADQRFAAWSRAERAGPATRRT